MRRGILLGGSGLLFCTALCAVACAGSRSSPVAQVFNAEPMPAAAIPTGFSRPSASPLGQPSAQWLAHSSRQAEVSVVQYADPLPRRQAPLLADSAVVMNTVPTGVYGGVELLWVRPHFSDAVAFISGTRDPATNVISATTQSFDLDYRASPRISLGLRSPVNGAAVQFTYWNYFESSGVNFVSTGNETGFAPNAYLPFSPQFGLGGVGAGIFTDLSLGLNVYDIEFFKPWVYDQGRWLLTGSAGVRIANYRQHQSMLANDDQGTTVLDQTTAITFTGAGPRLGIEARRSVGTFGALYARGGYALILGSRSANVDTVLAGPDPALNITSSETRTVTVADIEVGGSWSPLEQLTLSAGWMFAAWTDLTGFQEGLNVTGNSNLLSFDGLVIRATLAY